MKTVDPEPCLWTFPTAESLTALAGILDAAECIMQRLKRPYRFEIRSYGGMYELQMFDLTEVDVPMTDLSKDIDVDEGI